MIKSKLNLILLLLVYSITYLGCSSDSPKTKQQKTDLDAEFRKSGGLIKLNDRLFSIPSPLQISKLVKEVGVPYNKNLLNSTNNIGNYSSTFSQALNLGIYGADLGYLNMYDQLPDAALYFGVVKVLSKELGIMSSVDQSLIDRFEANKENKDSVMRIVSNMYRNADSYLMNNERNDIGIIILAGGWLESMNILVNIASNGKTQSIIDRIAEQKYPLDNLIELMRPYYGKQSDEYDKVLEELVNLANIFDGIIVKYNYEEPTVYPKEKLTVINSSSKAIIQDVQLKSIISQIKKIRKSVVE